MDVPAGMIFIPKKTFGDEDVIIGPIGPKYKEKLAKAEDKKLRRARRERGMSQIEAKRFDESPVLHKSMVPSLNKHFPGNISLEKNFYHNKMPRTYKKRRSSRPRSRNSATYYDKVEKQVVFRPNYLRQLPGFEGKQPVTQADWDATKFGISKALSTPDQKYARMAHNYNGRGVYSLGREVGGKFGRAVGGIFGQRKLGTALGRFGGKALENLSRGLYTGGGVSGSGLYTGSGAYSSGDMNHSNNLMAGGGGSVPSYTTSVGDETGAVLISHSEYISDIYAPGTQGGPAVSFQNQPYALNPALSATFPFLSQIAQNYDEYEFVQLVFHYRSTTTDIGNSTTGQCGTVILCTNYNAASAAFTDKQSMLEYAHAHDCKLTEHMTHGVECDPSKSAMSPSLFTRANPVVINQDLKTYDKGLFQIAIANCPVAYNGFPVGELWVDYSVVLRKPKLFVTRGLEIDRDAFYSSTNVEPTMSLVSTNILNPPVLTLGPIGSYGAGLRGQQNNIGCLVQIATGALGQPANAYNITFPASYTGPLRVVLAVSVRGPGALWASQVGFQFITGGNINLINDLYDSYGIPTFNAFSVSVNTTTGAVEFRAEMHIFVQMATQGINNTLLFGPLPIAGVAVGSYTIQSASLDITQYQTLQNANQNSNSTAFRPLYINNVGAIQIPT